MYFLVGALFLWDLFLGYRLYKLIMYPNPTEFLAPEESEVDKVD
jgi:hypothetical protein